MDWLKRILTPPLIVFAALLMWCEEWLWERLKSLTRSIARLPPVQAYEAFIRSLPPYPTMIVFLLPEAFLIPIKLLTLYWLTQGYWLLSVSVYAVAKVLGTAIVVRSYVVCQPKLMTIGWFRWLHEWLLATRDYLYAALRAMPLYQAVRAKLLAWKTQMRRVFRGIRGRRGLWSRWLAIRRLHRQQRSRRRSK